MTCIVGIIQNGKAYVGGDSAGTSGWNVRLLKNQKVFKVGEFVMGCCGEVRMLQLLQYSFNPPKRYEDEDIMKYMSTEFINSLRRCFKDGGFTEIVNNREEGGYFLVAWKDRLFTIQSNFQVIELADSHASVGAASEFAIGALDALPADMEPEDKIKRVLEIATNRNATVRPPFVIETT